MNVSMSLASYTMVALTTSMAVLLALWSDEESIGFEMIFTLTVAFAIVLVLCETALAL